MKKTIKSLSIFIVSMMMCLSLTTSIYAIDESIDVNQDEIVQEENITVEEEVSEESEIQEINHKLNEDGDLEDTYLDPTGAIELTDGGNETVTLTATDYGVFKYTATATGEFDVEATNVCEDGMMIIVCEETNPNENVLGKGMYLSDSDLPLKCSSYAKFEAGKSYYFFISAQLEGTQTHDTSITIKPHEHYLSYNLYYDLENKNEDEGYAEIQCSSLGCPYEDTCPFTIKVSGTRFKYTGDLILPDVEMTLDGRKLIEDVDYRVDYEGDCLSVGDHYINIEFLETTADYLIESIYFEIYKPTVKKDTPTTPVVENEQENKDGVGPNTSDPTNVPFDTTLLIVSAYGIAHILRKQK